MRKAFLIPWLVIVAAMCLLTAAAAQAGEPIGPGQHFVGLVNGSRATPVVHTVCPGPVAPHRTGPVVSGQKLSVAHVRANGGYTGPFAKVYAWFVPNAAVNGPLAVAFTEYGTAMAIPAGVRVPCDGAGRVEFSSCPYLAPCAFGWVPNYVKVQFVNVAA